MQAIVILWRNTKAMPALLRMFCQGAMVAPPILALLLLVPLTNWNINGREVHYSELWSSGAGLTLLVLLLMVSAGAWGLAARRSWSRWVLVAAPVVPVVTAAIYPSTWFTHQAAGDASVWLGAISTSLVAYACLFLPPSVKSFVSQSAITDA